MPQTPRLPYGIITCHPIQANPSLPYTLCPEKKSLHFFLNNFKKFPLIFIISGAHYHNDTLYKKHLKLVFKIHFSLSLANLIVTSSKMPFLLKDNV